MVQLKQGKQNPKTTAMIFESETLDQTRSNIALALLCGGYNSLRKYTSNGISIDIDKLDKLRIEFSNLLDEVEINMCVGVLQVEEF